MFKSIDNADQGDFFDFLRCNNDPLAAGSDWTMKSPELKTGLATDLLSHPFTGIGSMNKKRTDIFS